jgi:hypothetical protein
MEDIYNNDFADDSNYPISYSTKNVQADTETNIIKPKNESKKKKINNIEYKKSIIDSILESIKLSEIEITNSINILLNGIYYKGFAEMLQKTLSTKRSEKITILSDQKNFNNLPWIGTYFFNKF